MGVCIAISLDIGVPSCIYCIGSGYAAAHGGESVSFVFGIFDAVLGRAFVLHGVFVIDDTEATLEESRVLGIALAPSKLPSLLSDDSSSMSATLTNLWYG